MTAVSFVDHGTRVVTTNGAPTTPLPSGLADGDLILAAIEIHSSIRSFTSPPAGWTYLGAIVDSSGGPACYFHWKKYATGDTDPTFATTGTSDPSKSVLGKTFAWRNADTVNGPVLGTAYSSGATTGSNAGPIPGVAVTGAGMMFLAAFWNDDYSSIPALPAGQTLIVNDEVTSTNGISVHYSYSAQTNTTTGSITVTGHPTAVATRAGVQVAINEGVVLFTGTLGQSGSGSLSFSGVPKGIGSLAQTGSGSTSFSGVVVGAPLARIGSGSLTLSGTTINALVRTGSGSLSFSGTPIPAGTLAVTGSGTVSFTVKPIFAGVLARTGSGSLSLAGIVIGPPFLRTGSGVLTFVGRGIFRHNGWTGTTWVGLTPKVWSGASWLTIPVTIAPSDVYE